MAASDLPPGMDSENVCWSGQTGSALKHLCAQLDLLKQFKLIWVVQSSQ
jgi:hypothetical protein